MSRGGMGAAGPGEKTNDNNNNNKKNPNQGGAGGPAGAAYFADHKKGEVNELKALLRAPAVEKDPKRKREVIKKVIAYMTLGIDVSRLFTEMVMSIETRDLVVKKMVYHYLCSYAHEKPEMALMCINTLQRDCSNEDPMVRGLALRSLCSLRLPSVLEYIATPLRASLRDPHSYVRKTGVMGILKVYHMDRDLVRGSDMIDVLYDMLRDSDGVVVTNCIVVLNEIMLEEGGIAINAAIVHHVLGRLNDFNEWGLCAVLKLVARYDPETEDENYGIMNVLDPVLRTSNSGVVLEAIGCFVKMSERLPELHTQVYERVKAPLLTLMAGAGGNFELLYCLLKHAELLVARARDVFDSEYRNFYVRYDEPSYVKHSKVSILAELASTASSGDIMAELKEYASDTVDTALSKAAIRAIGKIALRLRGASEAALGLLVEFLDALDVGYVKAEALMVAKDCLRKYPELRVDILPSLSRYLREAADDANSPPGGRAAAIWIVGHFGHEILNAPYLLEPLIDTYAHETDNGKAAEVKLALLTAATRLFFKRPPEMQAMLGRLFAHALDDTTNADVRDRALFYFRLLRRDVRVAQAVVAGKSACAISGSFAEASSQLQDRLFAEFNTLAVVYGETPDQFVAQDKRPRDDLADQSRRSRPKGGTHAAAQDAALDEHRRAKEEVTTSLRRAPQQPQPAPAAAAAAAATLLDEADLLGVAAADHANATEASSLDGASRAPPGDEPRADGDVDLLGTTLAPETDLLSVSASSSKPTRALVAAQGTVDPASFQAKWAAIADESTFDIALVPKARGPKLIDAAMARREVYTMASGEVQENIKLFFYAADDHRALYLVQCVVNKQTHRANLTIKHDGANNNNHHPGDVTFLRDLIANVLDDV